MSSAEPAATAPRWTPWRTVLWFGVVSLAADMVYEGARSITGPYLASLGASALVVGVVTGAGEAAALILRLVSGPLADRTKAYWPLAILGYALTAVSVPLMAVAPFVGGAGLAVAATLVLLERTGKAIRSPAKSTLLAQAARTMGRGRGFAVHKALDQVGAFAGPLVVAGMIALTARTWPSLLVLAVPGALSMFLLAVLKRNVPDPSAFDDRPPTIDQPLRLPPAFHLFALSCAASTLGLMTFGIIGYHLVEGGLVHAAVVPLVYAGAMAVEAVAAVATGFAFDRWGGGVLLALPPLVCLVPVLSLSGGLTLVLLGVVVWAAATAVQDSTVKALVADLVPGRRLATAYGVFAAWQGVAALAGGAIAGALYTGGILDLELVVVAAQGVSLVLLVVVLRRPARLEG